MSTSTVDFSVNFPNFSIEAATGNTKVGGTFESKGASTLSGSVTLGSTMTLKTYTVAGLPAGTQGMVVVATDLLLPTFLTAAVGGGAVVGPVMYNGAAWVAF